MITSADRKLRVAVDVGGTFTDVCIFDSQASTTRVAKSRPPRMIRWRR